MSSLVLNLPLSSPLGQLWQRRLRKFRRNAIRQFARLDRQISTASRRWVRRQYFLSDAVRDITRAIQKNEDIVIGTIIAFTTLALAVATVGTQILYVFFEATMAITEVLGISMIPLAVLCLAVLGICVLWISGFGVGTLAYSVMHGLTQKRNKSLRSTVRLGLSQATRLSTAWIVTICTLLVPVGLLAIVPVLLTYFGYMSDTELLMVAPYYIIAAIIWLVPALMQTALTPIVALFEPKLSIRQTIDRSEALVSRRGRLFTLGAFGTLGTCVWVLTELARFLFWALSISETLTIVAGSAILIAMFHLVMTVFYRRRVLARTR